MPSNLTTVTASSVGVTRAINLDWMAGGPVTVQLTAASTTASAAGVLKFTLDDPTSSAPVWSPLSSTFGSTAAGFVFISSNLVDASAVVQFQSPISALRFDTSAFSTSGITIKVLQGRGW